MANKKLVSVNSIEMALLASAKQETQYFNPTIKNTKNGNTYKLSSAIRTPLVLFVKSPPIDTSVPNQKKPPDEYFYINEVSIKTIDIKDYDAFIENENDARPYYQ